MNKNNSKLEMVFHDDDVISVDLMIQFPSVEALKKIIEAGKLLKNHRAVVLKIGDSEFDINWPTFLKAMGVSEDIIKKCIGESREIQTGN